jgi:hypothetical protein
MEGAVQLPTVVTWGTLRFEWTGIIGGRIRTVLCLLSLVLGPKRTQRLTRRIGDLVKSHPCVYILYKQLLFV